MDLAGSVSAAYEKNNLGSGSIHGKENHSGIRFISRRSDSLVYPLCTKAGAENRTFDKRRDGPVSTRSERLASTGAGRPENGKACGLHGFKG
jgi:hypothetical protein